MVPAIAIAVSLLVALLLPPLGMAPVDGASAMATASWSRGDDASVVLAHHEGGQT